LLPLATAGLRKVGIDGGDIDRYLGVIHERVQSNQTGSKWTIAAMSSLIGRLTPELRDRSVVEAMLARQKTDAPVHRWPSLSPQEREGSSHCPQTASDVMSTDLFTVHPDDPVTLAASMMDWRHTRNVPVEDESGQLLGLVSSRDLLRLIATRGWERANGGPIPVRDIMNPAPVSISPETGVRDVVKLMMEHAIDCLPVTKEKQLVGLVTSHDLLLILSSLLPPA
jgi:CBS domain-containing protein